ncbi:HYC_CC_PP family protein [Pontibacter rugosus]|uniref:Secreted protein n=1 Tax=Pontibacter rugosus TaxID=1745966 RepID=A0ABW3SQN7_9BACT
MKLYRQIIMLTLTLLVLVSSTGMAVGMHLCGGELRDITFFGAAADCPMEQKQQEKLPPCHTPKEKQSKDSNDCCEDHQLTVKQLDDAASHKITTLSKLQQLKMAAVLQVVVLKFFASSTDLKPAYAFYESPPLPRDIPVLVQSFLL